MVAAFRKMRSLVVRFVLAKHNPRSNPSIERTFQRPLRALWPAAHVER
jgi:hypothetical protein